MTAVGLVQTVLIAELFLGHLCSLFCLEGFTSKVRSQSIFQIHWPVSDSISRPASVQHKSRLHQWSGPDVCDLRLVLLSL